MIAVHPEVSSGPECLAPRSASTSTRVTAVLGVLPLLAYWRTGVLAYWRTGVLALALALLAFAVVNVTFEGRNRFASGAFAAYS
ncbi:hypothetical protein [Agromyces salentinus]|uniref:Uncharacterized protein n=1 Tax=Agromyces salentinus TaxID=269421 RepID=A0ABP4YPE8_9MICO|nr:hypothetical protein [Agromyces salentinus]